MRPLIEPPIRRRIKERHGSQSKVSPELVAGDVDEGYGKGADMFRRNLTSGQEVGATRRRLPRWHEGYQFVRRLPQSDHQSAVGRRHPRADVFDHQRSFLARGGHSGLSGLISYDARWLIIRRNRTGVQRHDHGANSCFPVKRDCPSSTHPDAAAGQGPRGGVGGSRGAGPRIGPSDPTRLPRHHPWVVRIRTYPQPEPPGVLLASFRRGNSEDRLGWNSTSEYRPRSTATAWRTCTAGPKPKSCSPPQRDAVTSSGGAVNPRSLAARALAVVPGMAGLDDLNREEFRVIEYPPVTASSTARSVAKAYGAVATGGADLGIDPRAPSTRWSSPRYHPLTDCATR